MPRLADTLATAALRLADQTNAYRYRDLQRKQQRNDFLEQQGIDNILRTMDALTKQQQVENQLAQAQAAQAGQAQGRMGKSVQPTGNAGMDAAAKVGEVRGQAEAFGALQKQRGAQQLQAAQAAAAMQRKQEELQQEAYFKALKAKRDQERLDLDAAYRGDRLDDYDERLKILRERAKSERMRSRTYKDIGDAIVSGQIKDLDRLSRIIERRTKPLREELARIDEQLGSFVSMDPAVKAKLQKQRDALAEEIDVAEEAISNKVLKDIGKDIRPDDTYGTDTTLDFTKDE